MIEPEPSDILSEERAKRYTYPWPVRLLSRFKGFLAAVAYFLGYDLSAWQISANPSTAKGQGMLFVFVRALYGMMVDGKFAVHWGTHKSVLPRGAYLYYRDDQDPKPQAQKLYDTCMANGGIGELPPVVDVEGINNATLTASKIRQCVEEVHRLFGKVMIYTGFYVWRDEVTGDKAWASAFPLWIAGYPFVDWKPEYFELVKNLPPQLPAPWTSFDVWQFTSKLPASQYGVSGTYLDGNYCTQAFYETYVSGGPPPIVPPPTPGDDMTQPIKCVTLGAYINTRAQPSANVVDTGNFYKNEEAVCFPEKTFVKKADLPNKEIWRLVLKTDGTVGWAAEWHPSIKNAAGQQYAAIVDLAPPAPPVPTVLLQAIGDVNLRYYSDTNAQGFPIMKLPPVGSRPKFLDGAQIVANPVLVNADGTVDYYQVLNGHLATPATYVPPTGHTGWFVSETEVIQL